MTKFKQMRELKGIGLTELARLVGVKPPTVHSLEQKGIFDTRTAKKYAIGLKCHPLFLLEGLD